MVFKALTNCWMYIMLYPLQILAQKWKPLAKH